MRLVSFLRIDTCSFCRLDMLNRQQCDSVDSDVLKTVDELCSLPRVGPKIAFLALQIAWNLYFSFFRSHVAPAVIPNPLVSANLTVPQPKSACLHPRPTRSANLLVPINLTISLLSICVLRKCPPPTKTTFSLQNVRTPVFSANSHTSTQ